MFNHATALFFLFLVVFAGCAPNGPTGPGVKHTLTHTPTATVTIDFNATVEAQQTAIMESIRATQTSVAIKIQLTQDAINSRTMTCTRTFTGTPTITVTSTATPTATMSPTTAVLVLTGCTTDDAADLASAQGVLTAGDSYHFVPLCNGWVIYGDRADNSIKVRNLFTGDTAIQIPVPAAPLRMTYEKASGILYVTFTGSTDLAVINMQTQAVSYIPLGSDYESIALGTGNIIFVSKNRFNAGGLAVVDTAAGTVLKTALSNYEGGFVTYDAAGSYIYVATTGSSPAGLRKLHYDIAANTITAMGNNRSLGSYGRDIMLSPDGSGVVIGTGSSDASVVSTTDISTVIGTFVSGGRSTGLSWDSTGQYFCVTDSYNVYLFDAATYGLIIKYPSLRSNSSFLYMMTRFSGGDRFIMSLARNYSDGQTEIHWWKH